MKWQTVCRVEKQILTWNKKIEIKKQTNIISTGYKNNLYTISTITKILNSPIISKCERYNMYQLNCSDEQEL